ncbi:MAG: GNAT family N-acetyltransferase [Actinobacteria bacterium]|nr:GNAT family N-acetyltransferase [Actinomycetota bacterium]
MRRFRARGFREDTDRPLSVNLRAAEAKDCYAICEIYNFYIQNSVVTFDEQAMELGQWQDKLEYLQKLKLPFIVASSDRGEILGFAYVAPWRQKSAYRSTVEDTIYLRPASTGKRIGTKLLEALLIEAKAAGVKEVVAVISDSGADSSVKLHEQCGFKNQGHLAKVGFKFDRWLGTILMQKSL